MPVVCISPTDGVPGRSGAKVVMSPVEAGPGGSGGSTGQTGKWSLWPSRSQPAIKPPEQLTPLRLVQQHMCNEQRIEEIRAIEPLSPNSKAVELSKITQRHKRCYDISDKFHQSCEHFRFDSESVVRNTVSAEYRDGGVGISATRETTNLPKRN